MSDEQKRRGRPPKVREIAPEELREASNNRAEQGSAPDAPAVDPAPAVEAVAVVALADWIASLERDTPPMLVAVSHPEAVAGIYEGKYSGIRLSPGQIEATWSDGSKT